MKIALISFDSGVQVHWETLLFFKRMLEIEHDVSFLGCDRGANRCTTFMSYGKKLDAKTLAELRIKACDPCRRNQQRLAGTNGYFLDAQLDDLTTEQSGIIDRLKNVADKTSAEVLSVVHAGQPIGKLAFYDFSMLNKLTEKTPLDEAQFLDLLEYLKDAFRIWNFVGRVTKSEKFDGALYINGNYGTNSVVRLRMKLAGVRCWSIEHNWAYSETRKYVFLEEDRFEHTPDWKAMVRVRDGYRGNLDDTRAALAAYRNRVKGVDFNSYSSPQRGESWERFDDFRSRFKKLISVFCSSGDELSTHSLCHEFELDHTYYANQSEWLQDIIARAAPDIGYVIRLHPRMKPNKRESVEAPEYAQLAKVLEKARKMDHFLIIEPEDPISSYYIMLRTDLTLVSWSTIGLESAVLGVPSVICFPRNVIYPYRDISPQPSNRLELNEFLSGAKVPKRSAANDEALLKWAGLLYRGMCLEIVGYRGASNKVQKILHRLEMLTLRLKPLFSLLYGRRYRNSIHLTPERGIELEAAAFRKGPDQTQESLEELESFRKEMKNYFHLSETRS